MPLPVNQKLAAFQQLAKKAVSENDEGGSRTRLLGDPHANHVSSRKLSRLINLSKSSHHSGSVTNVVSYADNASSLEDVSSGEGSEAEGHRGEKKKGLMYQKTENVITRMRDLIAQWDVFTARSESPPFVQSIKVSVWSIPVLTVMCLWDTFAVCVFQVPHHSWIDYPGFLLGWHFVMMILAMYGFMLSYLSSGHSPRTKLAALCLGIQYLLLLYRIFMEIYFNGFRGQGKLYIERTLKRY